MVAPPALGGLSRVSVWSFLRSTKRRTCRSCLPRIGDYVDEVILVDGRSTDDTTAVAKLLYPEIRIVRRRPSREGQRVARGFAAATGDIIVMLDADGSTDPAEIPVFVGALLAGADFAKGSRFLQGGGTADMPSDRRPAIGALSFWFGCFSEGAIPTCATDTWRSGSASCLGSRSRRRRLRDRDDDQHSRSAIGSQGRRGAELRVCPEARRRPAQDLRGRLARPQDNRQGAAHAEVGSQSVDAPGGTAPPDRGAGRYGADSVLRSGVDD